MSDIVLGTYVCMESFPSPGSSHPGPAAEVSLNDVLCPFSAPQNLQGFSMRFGENRLAWDEAERR